MSDQIKEFCGWEIFHDFPILSPPSLQHRSLINDSENSIMLLFNVVAGMKKNRWYFKASDFWLTFFYRIDDAARHRVYLKCKFFNAIHFALFEF